MDLAILWNDEAFAADWGLVAGDLATDAGLASAVYVSLLTDRRADDADTLPDAGGDRRGWWGDMAIDADQAAPAYRIGSRLWLLGRGKQSAATAMAARSYCREALQWLIDDGVVESVTVAAEWSPAPLGTLRIRVTLSQGATASVFDALWRAV